MAEQLSDQLQAVIRYYEATRFDYWVAWMNKDNAAVHFGFYDSEATTHAEALLNTNRVLAARIGLQPGEKVLDAGCGQGGSSLWLALNYQASVTGITPVAHQVAQAQERAATLALTSPPQFLIGDYCKVPLPDSSFDVIWACESLCHAADKSAFYREASRLLRPGGRLIIAEYLRSGRALPPAGERLLRKWLQAWAIPDLGTRQEHRQWALAAGFSTPYIQDATHYTWISHRNLFSIARRWLWIGVLLRLLRIRSGAAHQNHLGSIHQYRALKRGYWYYSIISAEKSKHTNQ